MDWQNEQPAVSTPLSGDQVDSAFYKIKKPIGYALLLGCSIHSFSQQSLGSPPSVREDLDMVEDTLKKTGWSVYSPCLDDETGAAKLTGDSCEQIVNNLEREELEKHSCFMLYYSGYGVAGGVFGSNGKVIPYKDIVNKVGHLDVIGGKPKIFIFDCCRYDDPKVLNNLQNQVDATNMSYSKEIEEHLRQDRSAGGYPPPDCILCFSACESASISMDATTGSYFTMELCRTLQQFGRKLPFTEIVTQVNRGTMNVLGNVFELGQQPFFCSTLSRKLVLSATSMNRRNKRPEIVSQDAPNVEQPPASGGPPSGVGSYSSSNSGLSANSDVTLDAATGTVATQRKVFKSKAEIEQNITKLGEGVSVFIVYAPDPESPYLDPHTRVQEINVNEKRIFQLVYDLGRHGFHVVTDLHLGDKMPQNWLEWYTSRIELCNYILLVGSPAFCELFSREKPQGQILDRRAQLLLSYRNTVYSEITRELSSNPGASKFIPVLVDPRWPQEVSIPSLFGAATVYHLLESEQRHFNYDNKSRDFEKLVCRMAGINRAEIDKPQVIGVQRLPPPFHGGVINPVPISLEAMSKPRTGYKFARPTLPPSSALSTATTGVLPPMVGSSVSSHNPFPGHNPPFPGQHLPAAPPPLQTMYHPPSGPLPGLPLHYVPAGYPTSMVHPLGGGHGLTQPHPPPAHQPLPPSRAPPPDSLPDIEPDRTEMFLWLSQSLVGWPFIARYLGFAEPTIERIKEENPHNVSEQCFQMLNKWYRERPSEFSCRTLGKALFKSERNKELYPVFVQRVMAQAMDTQ